MLFGLFGTAYSPLLPSTILQSNQLMAAKCFDDTNILKLFIPISYDCSNQMRITSVRKKIFGFCKKYFGADELKNMMEQKSQKQHVRGFEPLCHILQFVECETCGAFCSSVSCISQLLCGVWQWYRVCMCQE